MDVFLKNRKTWLTSNNISYIKTELLNNNYTGCIDELLRVFNCEKKELLNRISYIELGNFSFEELNMQISSIKRDNLLLIAPSYYELKLLLGYEKLCSGIYFFDKEERNIDSSFHNMMLATLPYSDSRLFYLKNNYCYNFFDCRYSHIPDIYRILALEVRNYDPEKVPFIVISHKKGNRSLSDLEKLLPRTFEGSIERSDLLNKFNTDEIFKFCSKYKISEVYKLNNAIIISDDNFEKYTNDYRNYIYNNRNYNKYYDSNSDDKVYKILNYSSPGTVDRYFQLRACGLSLDTFFYHPQTIDISPNVLPEYKRYEELIMEDEEIIENYIIREGYENNEFDELEIFEISKEIFENPTIIREDNDSEIIKTSLLTPLSEVKKGHLFKYDTRDGNYVYYELEELTAKWNSANSFRDPYDKFTFPKRLVRKMLILLTDSECEEVDEFKEISSILLKKIDNDVDICVEKYQNQYIKICLIKMFEMAMYMRRWDGEQTYPLNLHRTLSNISEEELTVNIAKSMFDFRESVESLPFPDDIWKLRLRYYNSDFKFPETEEVDGRTVLDRYNIVAKGDSDNAPLSSCIRTSSNWFIFTSLYYYKLIFSEDLYNISPNQLTTIS